MSSKTACPKGTQKNKGIKDGKLKLNNSTSKKAEEHRNIATELNKGARKNTMVSGDLKLVLNV